MLSCSTREHDSDIVSDIYILPSFNDNLSIFYLHALGNSFVHAFPNYVTFYSKMLHFLLFIITIILLWILDIPGEESVMPHYLGIEQDERDEIYLNLEL